MMDENVVNTRASTRCSACKLPEEVLAALHDDRFKNGLGFETLARKYALPERSLSESGVRRHFNRHVAEPEDSPISDAQASDDGLDPASTAFANADGDELHPHALLEGGARTVFEVVKMLEQDYRAVAQRNPQAAQRVLDKLLRAQSLLARSVKQLEEGRAVRDEFRKTIPQIVDRITSAAMHPILGLMRKNADQVREDVVDYSHGRLSPEDFSARLLLLEREWPKEVGVRLRAATTEALKVEEAKVQG